MLLSLFAEASVRRHGDRFRVTGRPWRERAARLRALLDELGFTRVSVYRFGKSLIIVGLDAGDQQRLRNAFAAERL
jgi:hypothetical protein